MSRYHSSGLAGTWYTADPDTLAREVDTWLAGGRPADPEVRALIVPHAGHRYSGSAAGAGWGRIPPGRWRRVVLLAPSHSVAFDGAAILPADGFRTPLGTVEIDHEAVSRIRGLPPVRERPDAFRDEHAIEIQLPFLQRLDPALPVVPILVSGDLSGVPDALRSLDDGESLFAVSSDFTHYGARFGYLPFPATDAAAVATGLRRLDFAAIEAACRLDPGGFATVIAETGATVCGRDPIEAWLLAAPSGLSGTLRAYYTSLDVTGDFEHSVSYAAITFAPEPGR